jgi:hypothetical protein
VTIERKISGARCDQGRSWDFDRREIWVDRGCEGDFRVKTHGESSDGKNAAKVAGAVAAVAILGAHGQAAGARRRRKGKITVAATAASASAATNSDRALPA